MRFPVSRNSIRQGLRQSSSRHQFSDNVIRDTRTHLAAANFCYGSSATPAYGNMIVKSSVNPYLVSSLTCNGLYSTSRPLLGARKSLVNQIKSAISSSSGSTSKSSQIQQGNPESGSAASNVAQKLMGVSAVGYTAVKLGGSLKIVLPILKLAKAGPLLSMGLTTLAYGAIFGPAYGVGMVGMLFSNQLGSGMARYQFGLPVGTSTMIPFLGMVTSSEDMHKELYGVTYDRDGREIRPSAYRDALIAISGPATTLAFTYCCPFALGMVTGSQLGFALADFGFMLSCLFLAPVGSLPGGTICQALNKWTLPAGLGAFTIFLYGASAMSIHVSPIMYLMWCLAAYRTYKVFFPGDDPLEVWRRANGYYDTTAKQKQFLAAGYGILLVLAGTGMTVNAKYKKDPRRIREEMKMQNILDGKEVVSEGASEGGWGISEWALQNIDSAEEVLDFKEEEILRY